MDRLATFLAATDTGRPEDVALRALTLHVLEHVAPAAFAARGLAAVQRDALQRCAGVGYGFDEALEPDRLQAGLDAWLCRHLKALPHPPPDAAALRTALQWLAEEELLLYAWLLGELAARCGVDVRLAVPPRPFRHGPRLHDTYYLTHLVLLATDYCARPLTHADGGAWGDALLAAVPWLEQEPNEDLAGEVALCLRFMRRATPEVLALVEQAGVSDDPHTQATVLLALSVE